MSSTEQSTTETNIQTTIRTAGTLSNLRIFISAETLTANATFRTRVNAGNGSQSIAYQATGAFEDTVNTDSISAGDEICYQNVPPAANTATFRQAQTAYDAGGTTTITIAMINRGVSGAPSTGFGVSTASLTTFWQIGGFADTSNSSSTESDANTEQRKSGLFRNLQINIGTNTRTTTTTFRTRSASATTSGPIPSPPMIPIR